MKDLGKYLSGLLKLIKLETMTTAGRVNLGSIGMLVLFIIAYTTNDMLCYLISATRDAVKTIALKQDISDPYQTISIFKIMMPIVIFSALCFLFLYIDDVAKKKIDDSQS